jgi:hypothetical protein
MLQYGFFLLWRQLKNICITLNSSIIKCTFKDFKFEAKIFVASVARMHSSSVTIGSSANETGCVGLIIPPDGEIALMDGRLIMLSEIKRVAFDKY